MAYDSVADDVCLMTGRQGWNVSTEEMCQRTPSHVRHDRLLRLRADNVHPYGASTLRACILATALSSCSGVLTAVQINLM